MKQTVKERESERVRERERERLKERETDRENQRETEQSPWVYTSTPTIPPIHFVPPSTQLAL